MKGIVVIGVSGIVVALAACPAKNGAGTQPEPSGSAASAGLHGAPTHVGGTLALSGERDKTIAVTLSKIIDPATEGRGRQPVSMASRM